TAESDPFSWLVLPARADGDFFVIQHVADDFVERVWLDWFLDEVPRAFLQRRENVVLVADRRNHNDARFGMLLDDALDRFDAFHLRHGDVHEDNVRLDASVLRDSCAAVSCFASERAAERLHHFGEAFSREDRVVYDEIADGLVVLSSEWFELPH